MLYDLYMLCSVEESEHGEQSLTFMMAHRRNVSSWIPSESLSKLELASFKGIRLRPRNYINKREHYDKVQVRYREKKETYPENYANGKIAKPLTENTEHRRRRDQRIMQRPG